MNLTIGDTRALIDECRAQGATLEQAAYILASCFWETNRTMKPVAEAYFLQLRYNWDDARMERWRQDNLHYYPWYGRGHIQLTWEENYRRMGKRLGLDLTTDADAVMDTATSVKIAVTGCLEGAFTGKAVGDYINATKKDYHNARRVVNGTDEADAIAAMAEEYEDALRRDGYDKPEVIQPANVFVRIVMAILGMFGRKS